MKYVIIGNSTAAIGCVEAIRKLDFSSPITIISNEASHTYSRPLISYLLQGKTTLEKMKYREQDFYVKNKVTLLTSKTAVKIDRIKKIVLLDDGGKEDFDKLFIATGSSPFVPKMQGIENVTKQHTFMTIDDALSLEKDIDKNSRVLIIGAGLIGLKCAEGILEKAKSVTVVDLAPKILSSILDDEGAEIVKTYLEEKGIQFILANSVNSFKNKNKALLSNDEEIDFDVLVLAVGVRANIQIAKEAGLEVNKGILVNENMQTSDENIYAAGDCAEGYDMTIQSKRVLALLPSAYMGAECAGKNMAGEICTYDEDIPLNSMGLLGLHLVTAGNYDGEAYLIKDKDSYRKFYIKDGLLIGFIIIGNIKASGIYTNMIRKKIPVSDIDFEVVAKAPGLIAFGDSYRKNILGGVK